MHGWMYTEYGAQNQHTQIKQVSVILYFVVSIWKRNGSMLFLNVLMH